MRILTKKKVTVPPSANAPLSRATNRDDSEDGCSSLKHHVSSASTTKLIKKGSVKHMHNGSISVQSKAGRENSGDGF